MKFSLEFDMGNAAFKDGMGDAETVRILRDIADRVENGNARGVVSDVNGNRVGEWIIEGEPDPEPVAYWVQDPEGNNVDRFEVREHLGHEDARHDAQRAAETYQDEAEEELSDTDKALNKHNDRYAVAVELSDGEITTEGVW